MKKLSKRIKISLIAVAIILIPIATALAWWFLREDGPAEVSLESAVEQVESTSDTTTETSVQAPEDDMNLDTDDTTTANETTSSSDIDETGPEQSTDPEQSLNSEGTTGTTQTEDDDTLNGSDGGNQTGDDHTDGEDIEDNENSVSPPSGIAGQWMLRPGDGSSDLTDNPSVSFAGYRVDEVLAGGIGDFTAVGRTADLTGTLELTDTALTAVSITVDFRTLKTDNSNRDRQVQRALNTAEHPLARFILTEPIKLSNHSSYSGAVVGDLTINGITDSATFDLEAQLVEDTLVVVGSASVVFADYGVSVPSVPVVVSADDHGIMEFQLFFTKNN